MADPDEKEAEVTATKDAALPEDATSPPPRASATELDAPLTFPDDGPFAAQLRKVDNAVGKAEQFLLVGILLVVCVVGALHPILHKFAHYEIPYKTDIIHYGTFAIALFGGAFASHQAKHLSMDLLSRRFSPRNQLVLKVLLSLFVIFVLVLLVRSGLANVANERLQQQAADKLLTNVQVAYIVPLAAIAMIFHTVLHMLIDIDYLRRGVLPPERMRSAH